MQNYNFIQKVFHDIVLGKKFINKSLFEIEKIIYLKNKNIRNEQHIFITGFPRSGTTILLNFIYSSNQFASLTYRNMPFILSPNFSKLFNKRNIPKKERAHADRIFYDINSPESFDEVFFNNSKNFITNELLNYIQLILITGKKDKYLSKNNLNFKRINLINSLLPNSIFLIPIRKPLEQAYSLLNQHLHFNKLQRNDDFIRRYMNYLGHNEFGLNHRPLNKPINFQDNNKIDYWIEQWKLFYENIYNKFQSHKNCYFVLYDELSNQNYTKSLLEKINLSRFDNANLNFFKKSNVKEININHDKKIIEDAMSIYESYTKN